MSYLMKQEPAHLLLDVSYLSQLEQKVVVDAPLDTEGLEVEMEMNNLLLSLRPIRQVHCCHWRCFLFSFLCTFNTCLEFPGFCE